MNYRQVETSRELRLWFTGIIMPVLIGTAAILASNPEMLNELKTSVNKNVKSFKNKVKETL